MQDKQYTLSYYCVLWIDILNQKEKLRELHDLPHDEVEKTKFESLVRETFGKTREIYKSIQGLTKIMEQHKSGETAPEGATQELIDRVKKLRSFTVHNKIFSDSILVYMSVAEQNGNQPVIGVHNIINMAATIMLAANSARIPMRGSIDIGIGMEFENNDFYGPVLYSAYELENRVAGMPRVVVSANVMKYLSEIELRISSEVNDVGKQIAKLCMKSLAQDIDGVQIVDYLNSYYANMLKEGGLAQKGYAFAQDEYQRFLKMKGNCPETIKLTERYDRLRRYYYDRVKYWV